MPIEVDVSNMAMGDVIDVYPHEGKVCKHGTDEVLGEFEHKTEVLMDEVRANGRIPLIIGRGLTDRAREALGLGPSDVFVRPGAAEKSTKGYTLAQKMVGKACGVEGVRAGQYCEPLMTTVGSQDTTCLLYTSPSPRDGLLSRMPSSA